MPVSGTPSIWATCIKKEFESQPAIAKKNAVKMYKRLMVLDMDLTVIFSLIRNKTIIGIIIPQMFLFVKHGITFSVIRKLDNLTAVNGQVTRLCHAPKADLCQ